MRPSLSSNGKQWGMPPVGAPSNYAENAIRRVPGLTDVYRMTALLLAESTPCNGQVLVVGASNTLTGAGRVSFIR